MVKNAYIHIPFCKSKCKYCSFVSFNQPELMTGYVYALLKDIQTNYRGEFLKTLYIGGGTPSLLSIDLLKKIIGKFNFAENYELTIEVNPDDVVLNGGIEYFIALKQLGVNRLSIGSQTFDDNILKLIGRRHNSIQIIDTVNFAKLAGFDNISVDIIYGLPNQTIEGLKSDIKKFLELDIQHISTYGLKIDDDCIWSKNPPQFLPDEDVQADMYELINDILETNGFGRYEISNFARNGFESKHNLNYWNNTEYYGFGAAAHGYVDGIRYSNFCSLEEYMMKPDVCEYGKTLTLKEQLEEEIFLGFRKRLGINIEKINEKFNINFDEKYSTILRKYSDFIEKTPYGYTLNLKGVLISNIILSEFI